MNPVLGIMPNAGGTKNNTNIVLPLEDFTVS